MQSLIRWFPSPDEKRSYFSPHNGPTVSSNFCFLSHNVPGSIICFSHYSLNSCDFTLAISLGPHLSSLRSLHLCILFPQLSQILYPSDSPLPDCVWGCISTISCYYIWVKQEASIKDLGQLSKCLPVRSHLYGRRVAARGGVLGVSVLLGASIGLGGAPSRQLSQRSLDYLSAANQ